MNAASWKEKALIPLATKYGETEALQMLRILLEERVQAARNIDLGIAELDDMTYTQLEKDLHELLQSKPLQYILGQGWFMDMTLKVNDFTLIPRPETEELVELIIQDAGSTLNLSVLDIGTGTGCIPIYLKRKLNNAVVEAIDISKEALQLAKQNAETYQATITFHEVDILKWSEAIPEAWRWDIIVSNPPYIPRGEKQALEDNVKSYEPDLALFVPDEDPLLFYRAIAEMALKHLNKEGRLYFEIHDPLADQLLDMLKKLGYQDARLHFDLQGKRRMITASAVDIGGITE